MKRLILVTAMVVAMTALTYAQQAHEPLVRKIEVKGKADMEVIPDEIYLRIALKEYKDGSKKIRMDKLESQLVKAVDQLNLPIENLQVDNIYGYNWDWRKKKSDEFMAIKSFRLKVKDVKMINNLIENLDPEGVNSMNVEEATHSKIEEYKNQLKLEALNDAKAKASYLLQGIGESLGDILEIREFDLGVPQPVYRTMAYAKSATEDSGYQSNLEFKNIKLEAEISAVFEID